MTRTVCPNCGAPWMGFLLTGIDGRSAHTVTGCCGTSIEYIERLEATPTIALSVRLAEMEYSARKGNDLSPSDTLDLIAELRRYMAFAEEVKATTDRSLDRLGAVLGETT